MRTQRPGIPKRIDRTPRLVPAETNNEQVKDIPAREPNEPAPGASAGWVDAEGVVHWCSDLPAPKPRRSWLKRMILRWCARQLANAK